MRAYIPILLSLFVVPRAVAQSDSVDVTFRYAPAGSPSLVHLAGEFNNWANNSGGVISPGAKWTMDKQPDGSWTKTVRLKIGGGSAPGGAYQYKFNENGSANGWLADPVNPRAYSSFGNSILAVRAPTVFPLLPKDGSVLSVATPAISAGVFPAVGTSIDTALSAVLVDGVIISSFGAAYDPAAKLLALALPALTDGEHVVTVRAVDSRQNSASDSTRLTVKAAALQWLSRGNPRVFDSAVTVRGLVTDPGVLDIRITRNGTDTLSATVNGSAFSAAIVLVEGDNALQATGMKDGSRIVTETIILHRVVDHTPRPAIAVNTEASGYTLSAVQSFDPDGDALSFRWISEDSLNAAPLGIDAQGVSISVPTPATLGEYHFRLEARDPSGNLGIARNYIAVGGEYAGPGTVNTNPQWVRDAIVYEIFVPAFSPSGQLRDITARIPAIKALGVNTLWLMPIMDNRGTVNEFNGGYDIIDLTAVDESLGTLADFRALADSCHANGLRIILDITPNHVSSEHPWLADLRRWKDESIYRGFIETRVLGGDRGLGQSVTSEGGYPLYAHYSNWALPNINLSTRGAREAMLDVFRFWVRDMKADGYRMDVYWGPQNRYGAATWWRPFREELKRVKPDMLVLGETDGTGSGSEVNYAEHGGAMDAGYDWNWFGQIKNTIANGDIAGLNNRTTNYSPNLNYTHYTGPYAHYLRFLENHDEDRIARVVNGNLERTKPAAAVLLTAPGMPMIYAGQEVGWQGRRDKINFSNPAGTQILPWYQALIGLRNRYPQLRTPRIKQLANSASGVYTYLRPGRDANIVCAANFSASAPGVTASIAEQDLDLSAPLDSTRGYYFNDLIDSVAFAVTKRGLAAFRFPLAAWQSRVLLLADTAMFPLATAVEDAGSPPERLDIGAIYPNPYSSAAGIPLSAAWSIPRGSASAARVTLTLVDALGRVLHTLVDEARAPGAYVDSATLPSTAPLASGTYFLRLLARDPGTGVSEQVLRPFTVLR